MSINTDERIYPLEELTQHRAAELACSQRFTHLHLHTPYSLLDGFCRIDELIELAKEFGMDSIGVSEHGNCHSHIEFYTKCKDAGIKPVMGCEAYITPNRGWKKADFDKYPHFQKRPKTAHLLLIAKNNEGYRNLIRISSIAHLEGMYRKPHADYKLIRACGKGIIATSACLGGEIPQCILRGLPELGKKIARFYQSCFEEFYFELQPSTSPEQIIVNETLKQWSKEMGIPLVATSDAHMLRHEELPIHQALTKIGKGSASSTEDESDISVYEHCYFKSAQEMIDGGIPKEALDNAYAISQKCEVEIEMGNLKLPKFDVPEGFTSDTYLARLANEGLFDLALRKEINIVEYQSRMQYELQVIEDKGLSAYFLIVWDFINWAKKNGILIGPGRGSAAGSLVAFLIKVTNIDPIKYRLLFERMLNPERKAMPDIDVDIDYERRDEVIGYVTSKYGADKVAQIATFGTLSTRAAFKDIGRGLGIDHNLINEMNKLIPVIFGEPLSIEDALKEVPQLREWEKQYPRLFELAQKVEQLPRNQGVHACGVLIAPESLMDVVPLMLSKDGKVVAQYDGPTLEKLGLLKFDFLGLKNLSVINIARNLVYKRHGVMIDPDALEPEDPKVFQLIQRGDTDGIFQIESDGMKKMFRSMYKVDFESLIAGVSLYRPGPMAFIPEYCDRANGVREVEYLTPELKDITETTFGIVIYQEQAMQIAQTMAGYSKGEADTLRKVIGKKDREVGVPALRELQKRMVEYGHSEQVAEHAFNLLEPFLGYGFNRSHAAAYAFIAYQTAYFKTYYPTEFMAATMTVFADDADKVTKYIQDSKRMGIRILPPDVNSSELGFRIEGKNLRFGLGSIKGLGEAAVQTIMDARPFTSLEDLVTRVPKRQMNKKVIGVLALSGALDSMYPSMNRMEILSALYKIRGDKDDMTEALASYSHKKRLDDEQELLGLYVSGHPLDDYAKPVEWDMIPDDTPFDSAGVITSYKEIETRKGEKMAFVNIDTLEGNKRIVMFPQAYAPLIGQLDKDLVLKVTLYKKYDPRAEESSLIVKKALIPKRINKEKLQQRASGE